MDVNRHAVETINRAEIYIVESDLGAMVKAAVENGYLTATHKPKAASAFLISMPTPFKEEHEPDLSYVQAAAAAIVPVLQPGALVGN